MDDRKEMMKAVGGTHAVFLAPYNFYLRGEEFEMVDTTVNLKN